MVLKKSLKEYLKKFWFLVWKDDSFKGWIFSIIFIFVFIKFIFFPILSLATGTSLPLAIVESCSMYHKGNLLSNFDDWWRGHDERYKNFQVYEKNFTNFHLKNGFNKGDILLVLGANTKKLDVGDVVIFNANQNNPVIHRIVKITETNGERIFSTMGDNNKGQADFEKSIKEEQIVGKAVAKVGPYLGWIKLVFFELKKQPYERGGCIEN